MKSPTREGESNRNIGLSWSESESSSLSVAHEGRRQWGLIRMRKTLTIEPEMWKERQEGDKETQVLGKANEERDEVMDREKRY